MVLIECRPQQFLIFKNQLLDAAQIMRSDATVSCKQNSRLQPELTLAIGTPNVNVRRLFAFIRIEMKSK
jgi:hypothetical protein